jgi:CYTH domain-containing protein
MIPVAVVPIYITQIYLQEVTAQVGRRVRKSTTLGVDEYFYTEKTATGVPGEHKEDEKKITLKEFRNLMYERDHSAAIIMKLRHPIPYRGNLIELDEFITPKPGFVKIEVEVDDFSRYVEFPMGWRLQEVTGDKRYTNYAIAKGSLG